MFISAAAAPPQHARAHILPHYTFMRARDDDSSGSVALSTRKHIKFLYVVISVNYYGFFDMLLVCSLRARAWSSHQPQCRVWCAPFTIIHMRAAATHLKIASTLYVQAQLTYYYYNMHKRV